MHGIAHLDSATIEVLNDLEATRISVSKKRKIHLAIRLSGIPISIIGFAFITLPMIAIGIICFFCWFDLHISKPWRYRPISPAF